MSPIARAKPDRQNYRNKDRNRKAVNVTLSPEAIAELDRRAAAAGRRDGKEPPKSQLIEEAIWETKKS